MLIEILISAGIALGIIVFFYILFRIKDWLEENTCLDIDLIVAVFVIFVSLTLGVFLMRAVIRAEQEENLVKTEILLENGEPDK